MRWLLLSSRKQLEKVNNGSRVVPSCTMVVLPGLDPMSPSSNPKTTLDGALYSLCLLLTEGKAATNNTAIVAMQ